jgi:hypothetical protein
MPKTTYQHTNGETVTYAEPHPILEQSEAWSRVEGPSYRNMRKPDLEALAAERGLSAAGTVAELVERLETDDAGPAEPQS